MISPAALLAGRTVEDPEVSTPLAYVDQAVLERNIQRMAAAARHHGVALRPHTKTHKIAEIAALQLAAGASGLTVAKLGEAEAYIEAGITTSFMIGQPYVGPQKVRWQMDLAQSNEIIACVDGLEGARAMSDEAAAHGGAVDAVVIVDTGYGRFGVAPADAPGLAAAVDALPGIRFRGIRSHSGDAYHAPDREARMAITRFDVEAMRGAAEQIRSQGVACEIVSIGSTPGLADVGDDADFTGITEWRPGNYVFFDRIQLSLGSATLDDCALRVLTSVVSTPGPGRAVVDAGKKTLTSTLDPFAPGHGLVLDREGVEIYSVSEECGWVRTPVDALSVGDRLSVIPNHACEISNLTELVAHGRDGRIEGYWRPTARARLW